MKRLTLNLLICFAFISVVATAKAQTNQELNEIQALCTEMIVSSSQTGARAHQVIVFSQNGNAQQFDRAVASTGEGMDEVIEQLGRLRRIATGIISNQRGDEGAVYRQRSRSIQVNWNDNTTAPEVRTELAGRIIPLMDMVKTLSLEIRAEVVEAKNSNN